MNKKIIVGIGIMVLIVLAIFMFKGSSTPTGEVITELDAVRIPVSDISKNAQFYSYERIEYFVVEDKSGDVKTAFNACDVCYGAKKGYSQKGEDMVCNNCGNHYSISGLGTKNLRGGGCWPGYLPSKVEGDYLVIEKSDLETGRYRF